MSVYRLVSIVSWTHTASFLYNDNLKGTPFATQSVLAVDGNITLKKS